MRGFSPSQASASRMARNDSSCSTRSQNPLWKAFAGCIRSIYSFAHAPKECETRPLAKIYNTAWKSVRERAADAWAEQHGEAAPEGFRNILVHDLKDSRVWIECPGEHGGGGGSARQANRSKSSLILLRQTIGATSRCWRRQPTNGVLRSISG